MISGIGTVPIMLSGGLGKADIFHYHMLSLAPEIRCIPVDYPDADNNIIAHSMAGLIDALLLEQAACWALHWPLTGFRYCYPERRSVDPGEHLLQLDRAEAAPTIFRADCDDLSESLILRVIKVLNLKL
jgi:hypothetical protein